MDTWPFPARERVAELDALTVGQVWEVCELRMYRLEGNMRVDRWFALGVPPENSICVDSGVRRRSDDARKLRHQTRAAAVDCEVGHSDSEERDEARTSPVKY